MSKRRRLHKKYHSWLYLLPLMALILIAMSWFATPSSAQQTTLEENTTNTVTYSDANELNTVEYAASQQEFSEAQMANLCFAISDGYFDEAGKEHKDSRANDTVAFLDRVTGQTTPVDGNVPNIEQTFNIEAMAFPPGASVLYAANQGYLGTVDLTTGDHSAVQNNAQGQAVHFGTGQGYRASSGSQLRSETFNDVDSLSFDVITGVLWGVDRSGSRPDMLFQIDPTTGLHIPEVFPDPYNPGQFVDYVQVEPQNGLEDIDDIASHPVTGELYAIMNQGGGPSMLVKINKQTGETTVVGWYTRHNSGEVISDFEGLSFFNDGKLYGSTGKDFNDLNVLWQIDTETAVATAVGEFTDRMIDVEALGCLTAPAFVAIEKSTNGVDADEEPGVYVREGEPVVWDYFVRNTGGKVLYNVEVRDDQEGLICTIPQLDVGQSNVDAGVTCQATGTSVYADRPYGNVATVTANDQADGSGNSYSDTDPSHYYSYRPAAVGNYVWRDTNENGQQDAFEVGVQNATVELYNSDGTQIGTTTTNENGFYLFDDLQPGSYSLKFITPAGYTGLTQQNNGNDETDSDANSSTGETATFSLASGQVDLTWDAGLTGPGPEAALGDYVWEDLNANGLQDAGEPGIQGATVTLYKIGGTEVDSATTDADGKYSFTGLEPADYFVVFDQVSGYQFTTPNVGTDANVGTDNTVDSDADIDYNDDPTRRRTSLITLVAGDNDITWDAGFYRLGSVGDTIWQDDDLDGVQDAGESGIADINVILQDADGNPVANATTDTDGTYNFANLMPGTYTVVVDESTLPANYGQTYDLDGTLDHQTTFVLASAENKNDVDFGYVPATASLGDLVWNDTNANGVQDAGELGIEGVTVTLHKASDDSVVGTTTTAADGSYAFTNLPAGQYYLVFTKPSGFAVSPQDDTANGGTDATDSDIDAETGQTTTITLTEGQNDDTWDAGFNQVGSIGDTIWSDTDGDGEQDAGEPGIAGVTVTLTDGNGDPIPGIDPQTTDANGKYLFQNLPAGDYTITVDSGSLPTDVRQTYDLDGTLDHTTTVTLAALENRNDVDFGYQPQGTINGTIWQDNDTDGTIDGGEPNLDGITVTLVDDEGTTVDTTTTGSDGTYTFTNVPPGDYTVQVDPTTVPTGMGQTFDPDGTLDHSTPVSVASGQTVNDINFGYVPGASVGDFVWNDTNRDGIQDDGETGIEDVTVKLYNSKDELVGTTTTDSDGAYSFTDLTPGDYYLIFEKPADYFASPQDADADNAKDSDASPINGQTATFSLTAGQDDDTQDAGFYQIPNESSIGDFVWQDNDGDGVQDNDEPALEGVKVTLFDADGNELGSSTTDADGKYLFDNLPDGNYTVKVDPASLPGNFTPTFDLDGTSNPDHQATFQLDVDEDKLDVDFGYQPVGIISGTIWDDQDPNGTQEPGEPGIPGVTVTLNDENGNPVATTTTGPDGSYSFPNVPGGTYTVTVDPTTLPTGVILTFDPDGGDDSIATVTLTPGQSQDDVDFGYVQPASLGNFVWNDTNADGTQDNGETGIADVTVKLLDSNDQVVATTTTAADGSYSFSNLLPGDYVVHFDHSSAALNGMIASPANVNADDSQDSDPNTKTGKTNTINLSPGENDDSWDAGFYPAGSIGDTIWLDADGNGSQNDGEAGIANVTVTLTDANGAVVESTQTDGDGKYLFENLPAGQYTVTVNSGTLPAGVQQTADPDGTMDNQSSVTLTVGQNNLEQDFGYQASAPSITLDTTVYPSNNSGASCTGAERVVGESGDAVTYCFKVTNTGNTPLSNITLNDPDLGITQAEMTPVSGNPTELQPGESVVFYYDSTITQDLVNTATVNATDPSNTAVTDTDPAEVDLVAPAINIETTVYPGHDGGASCDGNEALIGKQGDPVTYCFTVTNTGDTHLSEVTVTDPDLGITLTSGTPLAPGESVTLFYDGNINGDLTNTATATGNPTEPNGEDLPNVDNPTDSDPAQVSQVVTASSVGDKVWRDNNGDGVQDPDEPGIPNLSVSLLDENGNEVASVGTDANGFYLFDELPAGTYTVKVNSAILSLPPTPLAPSFDLDGTLDHQTTFSLGVSEDKTDVDFGYKPLARISGTVFAGTENNGQPGIPFATVTLKDENGTVVATTTADEIGNYSFIGLEAGSYTVTADPSTSPIPGEWIATFDPDGGNDALAVVTVTNGEQKTDVDFGFIQPASLGDFVWNDADADGVQDDGENGIADVTVTLLDDNNQVVATTTTAADGSYGFSNLLPGDYVVEFDHDSPALAGLIGSPADEGADDVKDSDANKDTGRTGTINLSGGENDNTVDAGFYAGASIGDTVWVDTNGNGTPDAGEPGIPDVTVTLTDADGNVVATTTTDSNGNYVIDDLPPGDYTVTIDPESLPEGVQPSSDPDGTPDNTTPITVGVGEDNENIDFGYESTAPSITLDTTVYPGNDSGASCTGVERVIGESDDAVTYCFKVTNTGNTPLSNITLNDPNLGITEAQMTVVSGNPTTLQPGESVVFYYDSTITQDLVNTATVNATDPSNTPVTDDDPAEVDLVSAAIEIQTTVYPGHDDGESCQGAERARGTQGDAVTYCFKVTNTGDTHLDDVTVNDPDLGITLTSGSPLAPGQTVTLIYEGTIDGDLTNTATATGNPVDLNGNDLPNVDNPTDSDPAAVDQVAPSIQIENTVYAGHDGGASCEGDELVSGNNGDAVTYCFKITNNGDTPLSDIELTDPELGVMGNVNGTLLPGQSVTIHYTDTITGDLVNTAFVTGNPSDENGNDLPNLSDVTDNDPSEVQDTSPVQPAIDLQTTVYPGHDGGASCQGQELVTGINGDAVTYCYKVTNTGNTYLHDITIVDPDTGVEHTQNVLLPPGGTFTLSFETTIKGDLVNTATASGNPVDENGVDLPDLSDPTDTDPAEVNELTPAIQIENTVYAGHDSGASCEGSELVTGTPGSDVTYCFKVTNSGETHLDEVVITNPDLGITLTVPIDGTFAPGESVTVHYDSTIIGDLVNNATVTGNPVEANGDDIPGAQNPNDSDPSEVNQTPLVVNQPNISLEKTVYLGHDGGASCPASEIVMGRGGMASTFCFKVTNTGNTYLNNIMVSDPALGINLAHNGTLAPNESVTLHAEATVDGDVLNTATATGNPVDENGDDIPDVDDPTDDDTAKVDEVTPSIDIQTTVYPGHNNGASCAGSESVAGHNRDRVTYCFVVTNNGDTPLSGIVVSDPDLFINDPITIPEPLAPGESTTVYYDGTINGDLTNTATATGNPTDENGQDLPGVDDVTDSDPASVTENACVTSIGDTIWLDLDGDGLKSDNEPGISGATVNLIGAGPDGQFNTDDDITDIAAQTTNDNGQYLFTGLSAGKYQVDVDESTLPANYALTTGNEPAVITVSECEENDQVDFGYTASVCQRGVMYGVNDTGNRNSQFFNLDLGAKVASAIGPLHPEHDIEAIEIHPSTGTMYAIAGGGGPEDGKLYTVDKETGLLSAIGTANADDPDEIVSAAFDQQGTLWAFRENQGLMNVNLNTGEVMTASNTVNSGNWEGLAWDPDGEYLYGSEGRNLYRWDPDTDTKTPVCGTDFLPFATEALDFRFDGKMMGGSDKTNDTSLSIFEIDIDSCQILPTDYDIAYNDVESLTSETCVETGEVDGNVVSEGRNPQGLEGVDVTIMGDINGDGSFAFSAVAKTDGNGNYEFANLPSGQYKLTVAGSDEVVEFTLTENYDYQKPATITSTGEGTSDTYMLFLPTVMR